MGKNMILTGNRFEADISPSKHFADINDRKQFGKLSLLKKSEVEQLRDEVDRSLMRLKPGEFKPFAVKLLEKSPRHVLTGLNEEDGRELLELLGKLEQTMVSV